MLRLIMCLLCVCLALSATSRAQETVVAGTATVIDADQIEVAGTRVILFGIDAMDRNQTCTVEGRGWDCWAAAVRALQELVANAPVTCVDQGLPDPLRRIYAVCRIGEVDIGESMVHAGMALAFRRQSEAYVEAESEARAEPRGIWRSKFIEPWMHRLARGAPMAR